MRWTKKENPKLSWHKWFAWYPVKVAGKNNVWLEILERRVESFEGVWGDEEYWAYREPVTFNTTSNPV